MTTPLLPDEVLSAAEVAEEDQRAQEARQLTDDLRFSEGLLRIHCEDNLSNYIKQAWPTVEPATRYLHNWHIDCMAEHLYACNLGHITRLIINIPPKMMKSNSVSVMWPTWCWGPRNLAATRWMFASYSDKVSVRDSLNRRTIITSSWYQRKWGEHVILARDQNQKTIFQNLARGHMIATTMKGQGTGLGGFYLVIDDPHNTRQAESDAERTGALDAFDLGLSTRLDDPINGVIVVIMQRLHEKDLTGHLLEQGGWVHLKLPAECKKKTIVQFPITAREWIRLPGTLLWEKREDRATLELHRKVLGSYGYSGQYDQEPRPEGGGLYKLAWFRRWPREQPLPNFTQTTQSWDTAIKTKEENAYTVGLTFKHFESGYMIWHRWKNKAEYPEMKQAINDEANAYHPDAILIENKATAQAAIQELQRSTLPIIPIEVDKDKGARARAASPSAEALLFWIPEDAEWAGDFLDNITGFPKTEFNDDMDAFSQFVNWANSGSSAFSRYIEKLNVEDRLASQLRGEYRPGVIPICCYAGCGKELPTGSVIIQARGLKFCSVAHSW